MINYENDCVSCDLPCVNCGLKHNPHLYCDGCGDEVEELYKVDCEELCEECLKNNFEKITLGGF